MLPVAADAFIISSAPNHNGGGNVTLNLGTDGQGGVRRGLLRFNLAAVPTGATITSAVLRLKVVKVPVNGAENSHFELYRLLADWTGGTQAGSSGLPATGGEVTWNSRMHGLGLWSEPGAAADAEESPSASTFINAQAGVTYEWSGAGVVRDVQDWLQYPEANFGWLLRSSDEETRRTARAFAALESANDFGTLQIGFIIRSNLPPTVAITSPTNGAALFAGPVSITANAADPDSGLANVRFFDGSLLLGSDPAPPFAVTSALTNHGYRTLTAVAADAEGLSSTSAPVVVRILPAPVLLRVNRLEQDLVISWNGPFALESTPVLGSAGTGTWLRITGASPVTIPFGAPHRYFRAVFP